MTGSNPQFSTLHGDACAVEAPDNAYDLVHSNSVIEHVGTWSRQVQMADEVRRLAPHYYIQTPYMWFPYEPHFMAVGFHWLPEQTRARAMLRRRHGHKARQPDAMAAHRLIENFRLLHVTQMQALFPDAQILRERFFGLTKSLMAVR